MEIFDYDHILLLPRNNVNDSAVPDSWFAGAKLL